MLVFSGIINYYSAQNGNVGIGTDVPDPSAALEVSNTNSPANQKKGMLLPRVRLLHNTDQTTILSPASGLIIYNLADSGAGSTAVSKDTFYFWDGAKWTDLATVDTVRRELLPQIFFLIGSSSQTTAGAAISPNITDGLVVDYQATSILMNSGNHVTKNADNTFTVNSTGRYELSGSINYNPNMSLSATTNVEFIAQTSTDKVAWTNIGKTTGVWGNGTGGNSRTLIITPTVLGLSTGNYVRLIVNSTYGSQGTVSNSTISSPTGLGFSRSLKIQYLN